MTTEEVYNALKYRVEVDEHGNRRHYNHLGQLHCEEGPAVEWEGGAVEWYQNGKRHCASGPAVEYAGGYREWWLHGTQYTQDAHHQQVNTAEYLPRPGPVSNALQVMINPVTGTRRYFNQHNLLHRTDGPAIVRTDGTKEWAQNGQRHRIDGPAIERANGAKRWIRNGLTHRTDGPAVVWPSGSEEWWIKGVEYTEQEFHAQLKARGYTI